MNTSTIALAEDTLSVCSVFIFVILFIMTHAALRRSQMFSGWITVILSFCVTSLSLIGMGLMFVSPQTSGNRPVSTESPGIPVIVIPYAALGICLLIMFLLMSLAKLFGSGKTDKCVKDVFVPELTFPSEQKAKPVVPMDFPMDLNVISRPTPPIDAARLGRILNMNSAEHIKPNPKPSESKGIRYEK